MSDSTPKRVWMGTPPKKCDRCQAPIRNEFGDMRFPGHGLWGIVCPGCYNAPDSGFHFGTGYGQRYLKNQATQVFEKVGG